MENANIYMEAILPESGVEGRQTHTTGISSLTKLVEIDADMIDKLKQSAMQIGSAFADLVLADEVEMEFSFGITGNGNICILSGSSSLGIKVKFKWNTKENINN